MASHTFPDSLPESSYLKAVKAVERRFAAMAEGRQESLSADGALNGPLAKTLHGEFERVGIYASKLESFDAHDLSRLKKEMETYLSESKRQSTAVPPSAAAALREAPAPMPPPSPFPVTITQTPPYGITTASLHPPSAPGAFCVVDATSTGTLTYLLLSGEVEPTNVAAVAAQGIFFTPVIGAHASSLRGIAQVGVRNSVFMVARAGCSFFGNADSYGNLGFRVMEFDQNGDFIGDVLDVFPAAVQYDVNVNWGQTSRPAPISASPFSLTASFFTAPGAFYTILVWLWGGIMANVRSGPWGSWAAGFAGVTVEDFIVTWTPLGVIV